MRDQLSPPHGPRPADKSDRAQGRPARIAHADELRVADAIGVTAGKIGILPVRIRDVLIRTSPIATAAATVGIGVRRRRRQRRVVKTRRRRPWIIYVEALDRKGLSLPGRIDVRLDTAHRYPMSTAINQSAGRDAKIVERAHDVRRTGGLSVGAFDDEKAVEGRRRRHERVERVIQPVGRGVPARARMSMVRIIQSVLVDDPGPDRSQDHLRDCGTAIVIGILLMVRGREVTEPNHWGSSGRGGGYRIAVGERSVYWPICGRARINLARPGLNGCEPAHAQR